MNPRKIVKLFIPQGLFRKIEPYGHLGEGIVLNTLHGFPAKGMKFIGVTGTDGKTTTTMMIAQMLRHNGYKVGMLTTVMVDYGTGEQPSPTHLTTASVPGLIQAFKKMKANGVEWVVLETSSHALAQFRVWGVPYSVGVFTNLTHEHLDYHGTFERYKQAKQRLFKLVNKNKKGLRIGISNADDPVGEEFASLVTNPVRYGVDQGDLRASDITLTSQGSRFVVKAPEGQYQISCQLPGRFNVYNTLATVGVGRALGMTQDQIEQGIASMRAVPGRMMRLETGKPFEVYIDYAVTPVAIETVLKAVRETTTGRVMIVFGATGSRDKAKRGPMGEAAVKFADKVFLTDDETYLEDSQAIRDQVYAGVEAASGAEKCTVVADRREAIAAAIQEAQPGDAILITGMGHQKDRNMGGKLVPWNDAEVVQEILVRS